MPSNIVTQLIDRISKLEARVENLMTWQKWQMAILATILCAVIVQRLH